MPVDKQTNQTLGRMLSSLADGIIQKYTMIT